MSSRLSSSVVMSIVVLSVASVALALAPDPAGKQISEDAQARLLEKHGDQGIDADGDGTLTHEEVGAFFADKHGKCKTGKRGWHDGLGHGKRGMPGHGRGFMGRIDGLLRHLERIAAEAAPADFDLARFPDADLDGDGQLSDSEWTTFAEQARERLLGRLAHMAPDADTDGDGTIDDAELEALEAKVRERIVNKHPDADTDGDGILSDQELAAFRANRADHRRARMLEHHPEADLDGDGSLSEEEEQAFGQDHHGGHGPHGPNHEGRPCEGAGEGHHDML